MTDLYEVTMALAYLREGMTEQATFSLIVRDLPPDRGFLVAAGLDRALEYLERYHLDDADVRALAAALGQPPEHVDPLRDLRFTGDVWAVPEVRAVFAGEPLLEVTAPIAEAQLVETYLLNQVSYATALASKAVRCVLAAGGAEVVDFSLRRTHGAEAGMTAARSAAIAGFAGTSNVAAAVLFQVPAVGTMAHSFVEAFAQEREAFDTFARNTTGPVTLLADTYQTVHGVRVAADVLKGLPDHRGFGVRLDSGDLDALSRSARHTLDEAGLTRARIVASGGLDEYAVADLVEAGAPIDVYAVGTKVGTSADAPYLDSAYKLVDYAGRPVMKLSAGKVTLPGAKQVFRARERADVLAVRDESPPSGASPLMEQVMAGGRRTAVRNTPAELVSRARERLVEDIGALPGPMLRTRSPETLEPELSDRLRVLRDTTAGRHALPDPRPTVR